MKIFCAGGVSEHGRSCFLVKAEHYDFLLDCGVKKGKEPLYPLLEKSQIARLAYVFITHSHLDHCGALSWLYTQGFTGSVVMSIETKEQIGFTGNGVFLASEKGGRQIDTGLFLEWGRSGHCEGSLWFRFSLERKTLLYSGDYVESSLGYTCDKLRTMKANLAILDCAYGELPISAAKSKKNLLSLVKKHQKEGMKTLFPVPRFGRGTDLKMLFGEDPSIFYVEDPQLEKGLPPKMKGCKIVFTGTLEEGSFAFEAVNKNQAILEYYPVHMTLSEVETLASCNQFRLVLLFHGDRSVFSSPHPHSFLLPRPGDSIEIR